MSKSKPLSEPEPGSLLTRRAWAKLAAGAALLAAVRSKARAAGLSWDTPLSGCVGCERRYRVDAQVVLFSVPLLRRAGVGAATAAWRESGGPDGAVRVLEFAASSLPEHAAGLNRLGFMQERIKLTRDGIGEAIYFGLMTASGEQSAEEAREALHPTASQSAYEAVEARIQNRSMETATARFTAPSHLSLPQRARLEQMARQALAGTPRKSVGLALNGDPPPPFLEAMAELLRKPEGGEREYIYNGRFYCLRLRRTADRKAAAYFRTHGLAAGPVDAVTGTLRRAGGGKEIGFRLWVEESGAQVPLRIEFQPKPYLRLAFEAVA